MQHGFIRSLAGVLAMLPALPLAAQTTLKVVPHADLKILDPIWSGAYITRNHAYLIYDTLLAMDGAFKVRPQMAEKWTVSDDGLVYTFTLRDGLLWHDGTPVTAEDCVASLKRWAARDVMGQKLAEFTAAWTVIDGKSFELRLKEKFGQVIEALGKPSVVVPFMMPKRIAETDPFKQITEYVGSGPFVFKQDEWKAGDKVVYVKFDKYKPRAEPASGLAGGKIAKVDRIEWIYMPDTQTQVSAIANGEVDIVEAVAHDLLPIIEKDKGVRIHPSSVSNQYTFRMNWLTPPFNDVKIRLAAQMALSQQDYLDAAIGDPRFFKRCKALFTCGTPLASDAGMTGLIDGNAEKARAILKDAGYDGSPIVLLHVSDLNSLKNLAPVAKAQLERAGFKVDMQTMDWQTFVNRVTRKGPPSDGGWHAFLTSWSQIDILDPLMTTFLAANCEKARPGWPCDAEMEKLRDRFTRETDPAKKKAAADEVQIYNTKVVAHVPLGEWTGAMATRANIVMPQPLPPVPVLWGVEKK
jgi:peptide/nickel transport system substrate-binding protein